MYRYLCLLSAIRSLPKPDGFMHVYALPVGQGDSHVVQCPSGSLSIIDLGSSEDALAGYWATSELISFLKVLIANCLYFC